MAGGRSQFSIMLVSQVRPANPNLFSLTSTRDVWRKADPVSFHDQTFLPRPGRAEFTLMSPNESGALAGLPRPMAPQIPALETQCFSRSRHLHGPPTTTPGCLFWPTPKGPFSCICDVRDQPSHTQRHMLSPHPCMYGS